MTRNYAKSCRICLAEGSRDIFTSMTPGTGRCDISVSSVSRLLEKFRFVTMMQISESDNLPTLICDSCIVELNVAYNFKRQAIDTSVYLQRHMIEMGRVIDDIDMSPPRFQSTVPAPVKETPLEVKEEMLEPQSQIPASTIASMATNSGSPTTSVASGSSRSMVLVNTNSFSTIGADSTSDKDFVESYLPPKKRGREFQVQLLTPTPSPHEEKPNNPPTDNASDVEVSKGSRSSRHNPTTTHNKQITLRPRPSLNYAEKRVNNKSANRAPKRDKSNSSTRSKNTRGRFKTTSLTSPAGQSINPVAVVKTMLRSRGKRLTIS